MKRFLKLFPCIALAVLLACIALNPTHAQADSTSDLTFKLNSDGQSYSVIECRWSFSGSLTIPATYNGKPVTAIGDDAFAHISNLTEVTIPVGVTTIGEGAFGWCSSLKWVTIPNSVTTIGAAAFERCSSLLRVNIPDSVISIGESAFERCSSLREVTLSKNLTAIGNETFRECEALYNIALHHGVVSIGESAFYKCEYLKITIPSSVTTIGQRAFDSCYSLGVRYVGTQEQWNAIAIGTGNNRLYYGIVKFVDYCGGYGHRLKTVPGYNATCTEPGLTVGEKCTTCGEMLTPQYIIPASHKETTIRGIAATCTGNGLSDGKQCSVCGEITEPQEVLPASGHSFGEDATCSVCGYTTKLTADAITLDTANKLTVTDEETAHANHRAVIYFLGDETVEDICDEAALKAIDGTAKTHWGLKSINKLQLLENGNYVIHLHYNEGVGAKQTVAKAFTVDIAKPAIEMNEHKVAVTAGDELCANYRATVYYLGEQTAADIYDEAALQAIAVTAKTHWGLNRINKLQLLENGNYVIQLHYNVGTGAKQTVAEAVTVDRSEPTLNIVDGKLVAADPNNAFLHHRAVVYYLGDGATIDDAVSTQTYWTLNTINKVQLTQPGNYIIMLHYNLADSAKMTVTAQVTI